MDTANSLVLLKFHAPWCNPCKAMAPIVDSIIPEFKNIKVQGINIDDDPDSAVEYEVRSIPMLVLLKDGERVGSLVGLRKADEIKDFLLNNQ